MGVDIEQFRRQFEENARQGVVMESQLEQLREDIKSGEKTTGDRIKNHVIANYGFSGFNEELEEKLRELEGQLGNHQGQFVLFVRRPEFKDLTDQADFHLGIVKNGTLPLQNDTRCLVFSGAKHPVPSVVDRDLIYDSVLFITPAQSMIMRHGVLYRVPTKVGQPMALELIIGDSSVAERFKEYRRMRDFTDLQERLGRKLETSQR